MLNREEELDAGQKSRVRRWTRRISTTYSQSITVLATLWEACRPLCSPCPHGCILLAIATLVKPTAQQFHCGNCESLCAVVLPPRDFDRPPQNADGHRCLHIVAGSEPFGLTMQLD